MRNMPTSNEAQKFAVVNHKYDVHLAEGKWSVHIASSTGMGKFFGPQRSEGVIHVLGKSVSRASCWLPRQVVAALREAGFDCASVVVA